VIEGKLEGRIEMTGRRGRRRKQLLDDFKEKRGYWKLKEEALDRSQWRSVSVFISLLSLRQSLGPERLRNVTVKKLLS
jgi:hypothetical protein